MARGKFGFSTERMRRIFRENYSFSFAIKEATKLMFLPSALVENLNANNEKPEESKLKYDNPMIFFLTLKNNSS